MKKFILAFAVSLALISFNKAGAAELPRAQLDESERNFIRSYMYFLDRDYWSASDYLDRALKSNTYLVDYYLLKGLSLNRMGDFQGAKSAISYYLEVRPRDPSAPRILNWFLEQERMLRAVLSPLPISSKWKIMYPDFQNEFNSGFIRPFSILGMGKARMSGEALTISDTLGDRVYFKKNKDDDFNSIELKAPVVFLPRGDGIFYAFSANGEFNIFSGYDNSITPVSLDIKGAEPAISDAVFISSSEFVTADPVNRSLSFFAFLNKETVFNGFWAPPAEKMLFEPVGLASYGEWLAVADRNNEKVYFLNLINRKEFFAVDVPMPRDVAWSSFGEIFIVSETGAVFSAPVDFGKRQAGKPSVSGMFFENAWSIFFSPYDGLNCVDISGSKLCKAIMLPDYNMNAGFLSLSAPSLALEKDKESFLIEATIVSPFPVYSRLRSPAVYSVWNNRLISSSAFWHKKAEKADIFVLHRAIKRGEINPTIKEAAVENGLDVKNILPSIWTMHKKTLTNMVLDSTIYFTADELNTLVRFCMENGLELDIWARGIPPLEMLRASALTGGRTVFSLENLPELSAPYSRLQIQVPLPQELSSSGYPGRSMLTVYLDVGMLRTRDWIPLWPDLLEQ